MQEQQECLVLLNDPATNPKVFKNGLEAFHKNQEVDNDIHVECLIAGPSGTQHSNDGRAKVKEEELESSLSSVFLLLVGKCFLLGFAGFIVGQAIPVVI